MRVVMTLSFLLLALALIVNIIKCIRELREKDNAEADSGVQEVPQGGGR